MPLLRGRRDIADSGAVPARRDHPHVTASAPQGAALRWRSDGNGIPAVVARCHDCPVDGSEVSRAMAAAISIATALDLPTNDAIVLHNSNKLALRLLPCDVFARVAHAGREVANLEVDLATRLTDVDSPVAALEVRVEPRVYEGDRYAVTFWTYYEEPTRPSEVPSADYADALGRLHAGMRQVDFATPHFMDRVAQAEQLVASRDRTPDLADADRELLHRTLRNLRRAINDRGASEQLLHGEPHPGNVLSTNNGPLFVDLETCCRGPVEFDLAHVPEKVSEHYGGIDQGLLRECRQLVLAMVAAWRWDTYDELPNGKRAGRELLSVLRDGPPWPTLDALTQ